MAEVVKSRGGLTSLLVLVLLGTASDAGALCDIIPQPTDRYRGALGETTRSFAAPGRPVDLIVRSALCDQANRSTSPDLLLPASDYVVRATRPYLGLCGF